MADSKDDPNKDSKGGKNEGSGGKDGYIGGGGSGNVKDPSVDTNADASTLNYEQILYLIAGIGKDLHAILETGSNADTGWLKFAQGGSTDDDSSGGDAKNSTGSGAITYTAFDHVFFKVNYNDDLLTSWGSAVSKTNEFMVDLQRGNVNKISVQRFIAAYNMIHHYEEWLKDAAATSATYLKQIASPDSEFKGRAAYAIQGQVRQINDVVTKLHGQMVRHKPAEKMIDLASALSEFGRTMADIWNRAHANLQTVVHDAVTAYVENVRHYIRGIGIVRGYPNYVLDYANTYQKWYGLKQYVNEVLGAYESWRHDQYVGFTKRGVNHGEYGEDATSYDDTNGHLTWDTPPALPGGASIHGDLRSNGVWNLMNTFISDHVRKTVLDPMDTEARAAADKLAKAYAKAEAPLHVLEPVTPPTIGNVPPGGGPGGGGPGGGDGGDRKPPPFNPPGGDEGGGDHHDKKPPPFNPPGGDGGDHKPPPLGGDDGGGGDHKPPPVGGDGGDQKPPPFNPPGGDGGDNKPPPVGGDGGPDDRVNRNIPDPDGSDPDDPFVKDPNGQGGDGPPPPIGPFGGNPGGNPGGNGPDVNRRSLGDNKDPDGGDGGDGWSPDNPWDKIGKENNPWDRINNEINGNDPGGDDGHGGDKDHLPGDRPPGEHKNPNGDDGWSPDDVWDRINKEIGGDNPGGGDGNHPGGGDLKIPPPGGGGHGPGDVGGDVQFNPPGGGGGGAHGGGPGGAGGGGAGTGPGGGSGFAGEGWSDWSGQLGGGPGGSGGGGGGNGQGAPPGGMPMMPPMGGMGGGMGGMGGMGGGGGGGRERERQTWLSEDEEVWGADVDLGSGVIGRPDGGPRVTDDAPLPTHVHTPSKPSSGKGKRDKADKRTETAAETTGSTAPEAAANPVDAAESVEQVKAPGEANNAGETRAEGSA